ncbi:MAG TPA: hypothetical protein PK263_01060 [bacterium]|nr:hypothetical protein [bacterium]
MKFVKFLNIIIFAVLVVLLDVSFFSNITFCETSILSSLVFLNLIALFTPSQSNILIVTLTISLAFVAFSSLPLLLIGILFFGWPNLLWYFKTEHFRELSYILMASFFLISNIVFELVFLGYVSFAGRSWGNTLLIQFVAFVVANTTLGFLLSLVVNKLKKSFAPAKLT